MPCKLQCYLCAVSTLTVWKHYSLRSWGLVQPVTGDSSVTESGWAVEAMLTVSAGWMCAWLGEPLRWPLLWPSEEHLMLGVYSQITTKTNKTRILRCLRERLYLYWPFLILFYFKSLLPRLVTLKKSPLKRWRKQLVRYCTLVSSANINSLLYWILLDARRQAAWQKS